MSKGAAGANRASGAFTEGEGEEEEVIGIGAALCPLSGQRLATKQLQRLVNYRVRVSNSY